MNGFLTLFPLQAAIQNFSMEDPEFGGGVIIFLAGLAVFIAVLIILNSRKRGSAGKSKSSGGGGELPGLFSRFALNRLGKNIGLDRAQIKMLDFIFRTDSVSEPEISIANPALLDRHFRRAYRIIDQSSGSDEEIQKKLAVLFSTRNILENSPIGTLASTRQLKEDAPLTIMYGKEKYDVVVISSKTENLIVNNPVNVLGSQIKISQGSKISVVFFTKSNKGFTFESRVTGHSRVHGHTALLLSHSNQLRFLSHRRFRRRYTIIECLMSLVYVDNSGKKQRLVVDKRSIQGNIADISVGGCSIKVAAPVKVGAKFKIEFPHRNTNVAALGQVLRTNRAGVTTIIHVKFLRISQKSMNIINAYVYEYVNE